MGFFTKIINAVKKIISPAPAPAPAPALKPASTPAPSPNKLPFAATPTGTGSYSTAGGTNVAPVAQAIPTPAGSMAAKPVTKTSIPTPLVKSGTGGSSSSGDSSSSSITMGGVISDTITNAIPKIPLIGKDIERAMKLPTDVKLAAFGGAGMSKAISSIGQVGAKSSVAALEKVGTKGLIKYIPEVSYTIGTAGTIAVNTATNIATKSWIMKLASAAKNPVAVASVIVGAIGSYPFAGFIKEEALQTLGFASSTAIKNGDVEGAREAIEFQKEVLNPDVWHAVIDGIPYANIVNNLKDFYSAAQIKLSVDEKIVGDLKIQQETGETDEEKWARVKQEQADQEKANIDYYNSERKKLMEWENFARSEADKAASKRHRSDYEAEAAFWAAEKVRMMKLEEEDRIAIAKFWKEYKKQQQRLYDDSRPSKLNFGFL